MFVLIVEVTKMFGICEKNLPMRHKETNKIVLNNFNEFAKT